MLRAVLLCGVASVILPSAAQAQSAPTAPSSATSSAATDQAAAGQDATATPAEPAGDIVVTGSRITANGFQQPTPVTVVGQAEINRQAPTTIANYLNQLPSFGNATSAKNPAINVAGGGAEFVNLRNLGATRTLVLLDNRRVVESTTAGGVDTVTMPFGLIKRVEVVTGGASAAWGSDAVAGVVNFVLDRDYQGLGVNVESGVSDRGDAGYVKANVTAGHSFAGGKGHIVAEFDYLNQPQGVDLVDRGFFKSRAVVNNPAYTPTNGQPRQITVSNAASANVSPGGVFVGSVGADGKTNTALRGIQFLPDGTLAPYNFGNQSGLVQYGGDIDRTVGLARSISTPLNYANFFGHVDYDVVPGVKLYVEGFYGRTNYNENGYLNYLRQGNIQIRPDNAYLPATIRNQLLASGQQYALFGKDTVDFGPPTSRNNRDVWRATVGADGEVGATWKWHAYYTHGQSLTNLYADNDTIIGNFNNAVDAVRDPATNNIVCRSTLTNPNNGCVPLNLFGVGVASPAAIAYTHGTAYQRSIVKLDVVSVDASGTLFRLPAGDVSVAFGGDYIRNEASSTQDPLALAKAYAVQNFQPFYGKRNVKEGFVEAVIPILRNAPLAKKLELNAAGRITDYSTSGSVKTWKVGISDQIFDDLRVRGTLSHDIRAPTLTDLFNGGTLTQQPVFDSKTNLTYPQYTNAQGNPALRPEEADTVTAGVIYSPSFIRGLQLSVDYYRINIKGAIASVSAAQELVFCNGGQNQYCQYIHRDPTTQAILQIDTVPVNVASVKTEGWDFELDYRHAVGPGQVTFRGLASYVPLFRQVDAVGNVTDLAGQIGDLNPGEPKWKANAYLTYEQGPVSLTLNARYVGPGKLQNNWVSGVDVDNNSVKSFTTFGLTGIVRLDGKGAYTLTFGIDNLFDRDPVDLPVIPATVQYSAPGLGGRFDLYDPMGRSFRMGVRAKF